MEPDASPAIIEMQCTAVRRVMVEYLDCDLDLETLVRVDRHLENCNHCKALYDGVRNIVVLLGSEDAFELPNRISERIYERLGRSKDLD